MKTNSKDVLERVTAIYPDLPASAGEPLMRYLKSGQLISAPAGGFAFRKGDECKNYIMVLEGSVRVQLTSISGKEVTLYHVKPGGSCAITTACLIGGDAYPAEAFVESDIVAAAFPKSSFQKTISDSEPFREFVFRGFARRLSSVIGVIDMVALKGVDERLATVLLAMDAANNSSTTHQELAAKIGSAREVVSRRLKYFESEGLVRLERGQVEVLNHALLHALCASN